MAGRMRHRVTIQRLTQAQDALGQATDTWTDVATVWARMRPRTGQERYVESGEHAELSHEVLMRHGVSVTVEDRLLYDGRYFDIESVINYHERDRFLLLMVSENA